MQSHQPTPKRSGFSVIEVLLVVLVIAALAVTGLVVYQHHKSSSAKNTATAPPVQTTTQQKSTTTTHPEATDTTPPASTTPSLIIKEWGIKVEFADANSVTYRIAGSPGGDTPDGSAEYVDSAVLYLLPSITTDPSCQELGIEINRAKPLTAEAKSKVIGGYVYDFTGGPGACDGDPGGVNGSINQLRGKIDGQEIGSGKYTIGRAALTSEMGA
jgi:Tfp pilus assembly protein PilE